MIMNNGKLYGLPSNPPEMPEYEEEQSDVDDMPDIVDRTGNDLRRAYPNFIKNDLEIHYYETMHDQIALNGTLMLSTDANALGMLAFNLALIDRCNWSISKKGMNMEYRGDRKMVLKRNPALDVLKDAQAAVRFYMKEFKMTPGSRGNNSGITPPGTMGSFDDI